MHSYCTDCFSFSRYLGHCISYTVVASVLSGAAVSRHLSVSNPLDERQDALKSTVIRLRGGFRRKDQNSSSSSSEGCGSSVKCSSSSVEAGQHGQAVSQNNSQLVGDVNNWNNVLFGRTNSCHERMNSDKSDSGRPSLAIRSSSCRSVVQEPENAAAYLEKNHEHNSSLLPCTSTGLESHGCESSTSGTTLPNQSSLELSLAQVFQERLNDPRIASMLRRKARHGDRELANLLQDKGLDPNFAVMLKEKGLDPTILALLQRSSLDADRDHGQAEDVAATESDRQDTNQISFSEELRRHGLGKWMDFSRLVLHYIAGTPERAWVMFSLIFILETVIVAIFRPKTIKVINATHEQVMMGVSVSFLMEHTSIFLLNIVAIIIISFKCRNLICFVILDLQFEFGFSVLLLSPVVCSIMAFLWSLHAEEMAMTSKPTKVNLMHP